MCPPPLSSGYRLYRVMIWVSLARLKISCLMMCSRLSSSPLTAARTNCSDTGRSTRTTAVDRYRFGRYSANVTADASTVANTTRATILRRRRISSERSIMESSCAVESMSRGMNNLLWNDDNVAGLHDQVRLLVTGGYFAVVEWDSLGLAVLLAKDHHAIARREVGKALCERNHLEHRGRTLQLVAPRGFDRADDRHLHTVHFADDDRHFRRRNELRQPIDQLLPKRGRCEAGGLNVVDERQRHFAVGAHRHGAAQLGVLPHGNIEQIFGPDLVVVGVTEDCGFYFRGGRIGNNSWRSGLSRR